MQTAGHFSASELEYSKQKIRRTDSLLPGAEPGGVFCESWRERRMSPSYFCFGARAERGRPALPRPVGASRHITSMKKAGVALVELKRLSPPNGQLVWLMTPEISAKKRNKTVREYSDFLPALTLQLRGASWYSLSPQ